jgi:hypothetical protein
MATGSELQLNTATGGVCPKLRPNFKLFFAFVASHSFLRRANKLRKCFVSGETESVANTSAFVSPVALFLLQPQTFALR